MPIKNYVKTKYYFSNKPGSVSFFQYELSVVCHKLKNKLYLGNFNFAFPSCSWFYLKVTGF